MYIPPNYPLPIPNQLRYKLFFYRGFLKHPKRLWNYMKFKLSKFSSKVNYLPIMLDLEPNQKCNYKCIMCVLPNKESKQDMTFNQFKRILDEQYGLMEIKIQGVGEPLLNKDFIKMIKYAFEKDLWIRTTTNGSLLHKNENYRELVDSGVHDINISLDGASKATYEAIRIGGNFEQIKDNCCLINDYNNRTNKTVIRAWVVMQQKNISEFIDFPEFFSSLGFKEMTLSFALHNYGKNDSENSETCDFNFSKEDFDQFFSRCEKHRIKGSLWFHPRFSPTNYCKTPFKRFYLTTDQKIVPCCYICDSDVVSYGYYKDFNKIWYNDYVSFRESLKNQQTIPDYCKKCYGRNNDE